MASHSPGTEEPAPALMAGPRRPLSLKPLGRIAVKACRKALDKRGPAFGALIDAWPDIAGSTLAPHSMPAALNRASRTLTVRVVAARALELQHREREILDRIATYCGTELAQRIKIVQGPLPESRPAPRRPAPTPALPAASRAAIAEKGEGIANERLRAALTRLGERILESGRKKPDTPAL